MLSQFFVYPKVLIQLLVACEMGKDMVYFMFNDAAMANLFQLITDHVNEKNMTVSNLYRHLIDYGSYVCNAKRTNSNEIMNFYNYLLMKSN